MMMQNFQNVESIEMQNKSEEPNRDRMDENSGKVTTKALPQLAMKIESLQVFLLNNNYYYLGPTCKNQY